MEDLLNAFETNLRKKLSKVTIGDYVSNIPITDETYATVSFKVSGEQKKEKFATKVGVGEYDDNYYYLVTDIKLRHISHPLYSKDTRFQCDISLEPTFTKVASEFIGTKINF